MTRSFCGLTSNWALASHQLSEVASEIDAAAERNRSEENSKVQERRPNIATARVGGEPEPLAPGADPSVRDRCGHTRAKFDIRRPAAESRPSPRQSVERIRTLDGVTVVGDVDPILNRMLIDDPAATDNRGIRLDEMGKRSFPIAHADESDPSFCFSALEFRAEIEVGSRRLPESSCASTAAIGCEIA